MSFANRSPAGIEQLRGKLFPVPTPRSGKTIVVPLGDQRPDEGLVCFAAGLAKRLKGRVRLVQLRIPSARDAADDMVVTDDGERMIFRLRSADHIDAIVRRCEAATNVELSVSARNGTDLASTVKEECRTGSELVIFRRDSRPAWSQFWLERQLRELLHLPVPVLILPPTATSPANPFTIEFERVLVGMADDTATNDVVQLAMNLAGGRAHYHLLRVLPMRLLTSIGKNRLGRTPPNCNAANSRNQAWFALRQTREQMEQQGATVDANIVFDNLAAGRAMLSRAVTRQADLIVIARRPPRLLPFGHCDWKHVALNSPVPVLLCPDHRL